MTPQKRRFLRTNKVLGAQKSFFGPPKTQKSDFLKKLQLYDYPKVPSYKAPLAVLVQNSFN